MIPAVSSHRNDAYAAARNGAAIVERARHGRVVVSGPDRASYLQGLLTNDVAALKAGEGCYAAYLTPQGRMIADMNVYELGDVMLLTLDRQVKDVVLAKLDQFIFGENVQLSDVTEAFGQLVVVGPDAARVLSSVLDGVTEDALATLPEYGNVRASWRTSPVIVARVFDPGEPGFDVFVDRAQADAFKEAIAAAGATPLDDTTANAIRIEAGIPLFHCDMDEDTIPLEAGIENRAISFTKGCYVGQEVIIRVLHRGHGRVARKLVGLTIDGDEPPAQGVHVFSADRDVGHVTSSAQSPALNRRIALAYVHRDFVEPGTTLAVSGRRATVTALPFVQRP